MTQHFNRGSERDKRKTLRSNATEAEQRLWQHLRAQQLGAKFRRQYSVDTYVLDFYAPRLKLGIEVDGDSHFTPGAIEYDQERTAHLQRFGMDVLRFTNREVIQNVDGVLAAIEEAIKKRIPLLTKEGLGEV